MASLDLGTKECARYSEGRSFLGEIGIHRDATASPSRRDTRILLRKGLHIRLHKLHLCVCRVTSPWKIHVAIRRSLSVTCAYSNMTELFISQVRDLRAAFAILDCSRCTTLQLLQFDYIITWLYTYIILYNAIEDSLKTQTFHSFHVKFILELFSHIHTCVCNIFISHSLTI